MTGWWLSDLWQVDRVLAISWVVWVIGSITLHELSHGWAAIRAGDRTPIETGHMTWNPLVHMGGMSLIMFALVGIAWGMMPIDPRRFRHRTDEAVVAFAGPLMNLGLWFACVVLFSLWVAIAGGHWFGSVNVPDHFYDNVQTFLRAGAMLNLVLFIFNLLPAPPMDGARILSTFSPAFRRLWQAERGAIVAVIVFIVIFRFAGGIIFPIAGDITRAAIGAILYVIT